MRKTHANSHDYFYGQSGKCCKLYFAQRGGTNNLKVSQL
nr:MAG TPA: hypothetical protein [Caudoviricetes sp.]